MPSPRIWRLPENFSASHAAYVALAETLGDEPVPLLTADAHVARAVAEHVGVPSVVVG